MNLQPVRMDTTIANTNSANIVYLFTKSLFSPQIYLFNMPNFYTRKKVPWQGLYYAKLKFVIKIN